MQTLGAARLAKEIPAQRAVATFVPRDEITAVLQDPESDPELYLRLTGSGLDEDDEANTIAITWSRDELERLLEGATGDHIMLTFDRDELSQAMGDVEAHGLRERALVFAVAATGALGTGVGIANAMPGGDDGGRAAASISAPATLPSSVTDVSSAGGYAAPATAGVDSTVSDAASGGGYTAPAAAADVTITDVSSGGGYAAPATAASDSIISDAATGAGYAAPATAASDSIVSDAASGAGYAAPATAASDSIVSDAASGAGYAATSEGSAADAIRTDASLSGGYGAVESTGSSGEFLSIDRSDATDALLAGGILLAIAGATFASRRGGTVRPA